MRFNVPDAASLEHATNGELTCFQVWLPDNVAYRSMFAGLLWLLARGRSYDENSGIVKDAQRAGYRIFERNMPLVACGECEDCDAGDGETGGSGSVALNNAGDGIGEELFDMWAVTDVTIERGLMILHYGPCCETEVNAAGLITAGPDGASADGGEENPYDTLPDELQPAAFYGCGKASAIIGAVMKVAGSMMDHFGNPLTLVKNVRGDNPEFSIGATWLWNAYMAYTVISGLELVDPASPDGADDMWEKDTILDPVRLAKLRCVYARRFSDDNARPTEADIKALRDLMLSVYPLFVTNMLNDIILSIGDGDLRDVGLMGAVDSTADCMCPDTSMSGWYTAPSEATWLYEIDFTTGQHGFVDSEAGHTYLAGAGFKASLVKDDQTGNWSMVRTARASDTGLVDTRLIYMACHSSTLPTGTHMRNPLTFELGGGAFFTTSNMPLLSAYVAYIAGGVAWGSEVELKTFCHVTFDAGPLDQGTHTLDKLVIAGTGTPPYSDLTNLLP